MPRFKLLNNIKNKMLVSRYLQRFWRFFQVKAESTEIDCAEVGGVMKLDIPETWPNITLKSLAAIRFVHDHYTYDFLVRANATCYVNIASLKTHLESLNTKFIYAGPKAINKEFISGWGIILNPSAIENLLGVEDIKYLELFDDEAFGRMLKSSGIEPLAIPYLEITSFEELHSRTREELVSFPLIRVKALRSGKRIDDAIMCELHEIIGE